MSHERDHAGGEAVEIRASTVLPARRLPLTLTTADGLRLVGELALPESRPPAATLVCLHPLPTHGGMMDSHVLRKAAWRLPALAGLAVLRFNTRGTSSAAGTSEGSFDEAVGEGLDLEAAVLEATGRGLPNVWLLGWSFGTDVVLRHGLLPGVVGAVLLSPPLRHTGDDELGQWAADGRPLVALVPELDDYLRPQAARERFSRVPQAEVVGVDGAKHLWVGEPYVRRVLDEVVVRVVDPSLTPLPTTWQGPYSTHSDL
ncbi:MAG TPA: alpha/beta hydrolase [Ornithinibacter sp.]|nr:alpha/beta hydrolase [Ornithinibacter sp.]